LHVGEGRAAECVGRGAQSAEGGQVGGTQDGVDGGRSGESELECLRGQPRGNQADRQGIGEHGNPLIPQSRNLAGQFRGRELFG
jgi:hypothetical protein